MTYQPFQVPRFMLADGADTLYLGGTIDDCYKLTFSKEGTLSTKTLIAKYDNQCAVATSDCLYLAA